MTVLLQEGENGGVPAVKLTNSSSGKIKKH
jgi:hypothetical protein